MTDTNQETQTPGAEQKGPEIDVQPAQQKRGRGRPPKNPPGETGPQKEDPTGGTASTSTAKPRKAKGGKVDATQLARQLVGLHELACMATGNQFPELRISGDEANMLAGGIASVCEHYDLSIDGKTGAFLNLFAAAAMVYAPRIMSIRQRVNAARPVDVQPREIHPTQPMQ